MDNEEQANGNMIMQEDNNEDNDPSGGEDRREDEGVEVLPYENWAVAVGGRRVEDPLPEDVVHVMNQVFQNDMLVENILEKVIFSRDRPAIRSCRLVSKPWVCAISKLYKKMKKPLFLVNTSRDLFPHNDPPRPIFDHHSVLCEFLRPMTRPGRIEGFVPTFALHLAPHYFRKCNYTDFVNCLVQCGPSLVELFITFPKNSLMSFLLPPGISFPNLMTMGVSFTGVTLQNSLYVGPFAHHHEYFPNHSSVHLVQSILNAAGNLRNFTFMRCQNPNNPPDMENLYLPDNIVSLKVETPLRGFDLLLHKNFENLAELTLNASLVLYSEGEIFELLSKLSSTLRVLNLAGTTSLSYRHSLPVKLPRMESLTKFAMFKPWEFEIRNPPLSFEEILPKLETLVFATQTEGSFSYLMSGMRSTTVTSFSVWLTSLASYRAPPHVVGGVLHPMMNYEPNRFIQIGIGAGAGANNPLMMGQPRLDLDLMPAHDLARARRALRARQYRQEMRQRLHHAAPLPNENADDDVLRRLNDVLLPPPLPRVVGGAGPRDPLDGAPPVVVADERQEEQHLLRMRRARLRMAHDLQHQRRLILDRQNHQRRRELMARERDAVEPRVLEIRRRLQELRGRLNIEDIPRRMVERLRRVNADQGVEVPPPPEIRIEVVPNGHEDGNGRRPGPLQVDVAEELSSTDSEDELEDMLERMIPPVPNVAEEERRMRPLQVLAAAAIAEENIGRIQERVRAMENNMNEIEARNDPRPEAEDAVRPQGNQDQEDAMQLDEGANVDGGRHVQPHPINQEGNNENGNEEVAAAEPNHEVRENGGAGVRVVNNENVGGEEGIRFLGIEQLRRNGINEAEGFIPAHHHLIHGMERARAAVANGGGGALIGAEALFDDIELPVMDVGGGGRRDGQNPRFRNFRRLHHQLLEQYRRHRPAARQQQHHLLPDRPVTMTKEKMQQINVAFINLTKLKINICGPEVCGLKYIFEEMKSLQVLKIVVEKSLWPIKWDSLLTGIPMEFCLAVKSSSELWDEVYLHENQVSIRSLTKLEELGILECLKVNEQARQDGVPEDHLISDVAFHFALLKMKNLKHLTVTSGFSPSPAMVQKWYQEKGYPITVKSISSMDTEYEEN